MEGEWERCTSSSAVRSVGTKSEAMMHQNIQSFLLCGAGSAAVSEVGSGLGSSEGTRSIAASSCVAPSEVRSARRFVMRRKKDGRDLSEEAAELDEDEEQRLETEGVSVEDASDTRPRKTMRVGD